jgi:hypothetical protein
LGQCPDKELKNSARMRSIVTAALQQQYSQTELTFWITYALSSTAGQQYKVNNILKVCRIFVQKYDVM